jgi:hypothetical protein
LEKSEKSQGCKNRTHERLAMKYKYLDKENYFDQAEALHTVLTLWHDGQWSETYALLCRSKFKPGPFWSESEVQKNNSYYQELEQWTSDNQIDKLRQLMDEIEHFLDNQE